MQYVFKLNRTVGPDVNHDLSDVLKVKTALGRLGLFETPEYGIDEFPDQPMLDGIKRFQVTENLAADKVMKSDGPTYHRMAERLREQDLYDAPTPPIYGGEEPNAPSSGDRPSNEEFFGDEKATFDPRGALKAATDRAREAGSLGEAIGAGLPGGARIGKAVGTALGGAGGFLLGGFGNRTGNIGLVDPAAGP
tara:strand:+ start:2399 stop:2977 length:579 start_codon:yes stop_codon:yes gene_type:complete